MSDDRADPTNCSADYAGAAVLVENHRAFLRYLERRVGSRDAAEDLLQDAFARNLDKLHSIPEEAMVPWFYRVLRNALIDHTHRQASADRALASFAKELEDVDEMPVKAFAASAGLTTSNAGVRLHRARQALRSRVAASCGTCAEHGCVDCTCGTSERGGRV